MSIVRPLASSSDSGSRRISSGGAFITFFKSLFGAGLLAVPNVLGRVGLPLGVFICLLVAAGCSMTCHVLLRAREITQRCLEEEAEALHPSGELFTPHNRRRFSNESGGGGDGGGCGGSVGGVAPCHCRDGTPSGEGWPFRHPHHHLVTYGDLADVVLGQRMASVTRWTIIGLNVLFTAGLVIVIGENMGPALGWDDEVAARRAVALVILPLVTVLLQIPWLQDLCFISALGLGVYSVGVIGSTIFSAIGTIREGGGGDTFGRGVPEDLWELKWDGVPAFVGSAVYALEGISLAMPTAHSMRQPEHADCVVTGAVFLYGFVTVVFSSIGYAGGLGGGPGTGLSAEECDVVTNCITPPQLRTTIQYALSVAMLLGIPVMLYPATEMLEVMMTDRKEELEATRSAPKSEVSMVEYKRSGSGGEPVKRLDSKTNLMEKQGVASRSSRLQHDDYGARYVQHVDDNFTDEGSVPCDHHAPAMDDGYSQQKSWKLRLFLAFLVVFLGLAGARSFTLFSGLVGAVGLTFAGFVLPVLIYVRATERAGLRVSRPMKAALAILGGFGVINMVVGGIGSLVELVQGLSGG